MREDLSRWMAANRSLCAWRHDLQAFTDHAGRKFSPGMLLPIMRLGEGWRGGGTDMYAVEGCAILMK